MSISEFVGILFSARDAAHIHHLATKSIANHLALGTFYEGIVPLADKLAEGWQGRHGLIEGIDPQAPNLSKSLVDMLSCQLKVIEDERCEVIGEDSALQSVVDEIVLLYLSTIYKIKHLA